MKDSAVVTLRQPGEFADLPSPAEALAAHTHLTTDDGRQRLVRHGAKLYVERSG